MNRHAESILRLRSIACALPGQWLYLLGDEGGVVYSQTQNRFAGLSAAGISAYRALDAGASVEDLGTHWAGAARHPASADGMDTIAALARGLFPAEDPLLELLPLQHPMTANIKIHDIPAAVEFPREPLEDLCRDYFRNCPAGAGSAKFRIHSQYKENGWTVYVNDWGLLSSLADRQLGLGFLHAARSLLYAESRYDAAFHAAMVANNACGVLLSGPREAGKSTLAAYLAARGFDLLTDEPALLDLDAGCVSSLSFPLSLKEQSWRVLGDPWTQLGTQLARSSVHADSPIHVRSDGIRIKLLHLPRRSTQSRLLTHIVFPEYRPSCATRAERLQPLQCLHLLNEAGMILAKDLPRHKFEALLRMICMAPSYRLQYSSLAEAASTIGSLSGE